MVMSSGCKHQLPSNTHGHCIENSTRRVWGGMELINA